MSKKCRKNANDASSPSPSVTPTPRPIKKHSSPKTPTMHARLSAIIGVSNVERWIQLKSSTNFQSNEEFVKALLDLAAIYLIRNNAKCAIKDGNHGNQDGDNAPKETENPSILPKKKKEHKHKKRKHANDMELENFEPANKDESTDKKIKPSIMVNISNDLLAPLQVPKPKAPLIENIVKPFFKEETKIEIMDNLVSDIKPKDKAERLEKAEKIRKLKLKECDEDVGRSPDVYNQEKELDTKEGEAYHLTALNVSTAIKSVPETQNNSNLCSMCETEHATREKCLIQSPKFCISDAITLETWRAYQEPGNDANGSRKTFAVNSLPAVLTLDDLHHAGWESRQGVFAAQLIEAFTQFGPLVAPQIKEVDVPEDCTMRYMFEVVRGETERVYFNAENEEESNWVRFLRPAATREQRNVLVVARADRLYLVTSRNVAKGEELVYWQDDTSGSKKKMEKTTCGGCNMTFQHPLQYRIHCSVFHDVRYSLTIRKYHCKVCGAAVLGKENIMKHATEMHNGQGAYQCQFCKKFFLRLNYLEMHRTYGCSANPHRSRPLCDFCGRKFCQPQKLKVHIKRMHSDMSEVLKEFQCKNCMKILGSRAALQRHFKEVHQKQVDGACACSKCGKTFQNKSNLKIHMLTHSGIKPFRCNQSNCAAAFTTKQCLQFHYKKVHGYAEDMMPKIERSVDYTFEAYSGNGEDDLPQDGVEEKEEQNEAEKSAADPVQSNDQSSVSSTSPTPPTTEAYAQNAKMPSKGSKKWIGEQPDVYDAQNDVGAQAAEPTPAYDKTSYDSPGAKLLGYNRHESNASLLVEAALDSVCSEPNIDIDVAGTPCADALVNNLYGLSNVHNVHGVHDDDALADVPYAHSADVADSRDIRLISPSVNEQISVTDDIDELRHDQAMGIDYSSFHQEDFSPPNSPRNFRDYIAPSPSAHAQPQGVQGVQAGHQHNVHQHAHAAHAAHGHNHGYPKPVSPTGVASPPRYDFGASVVVNSHESDDSNNGVGVQNLSLHADKFPDVAAGRDGIQLDLSIYKSHYTFDSSSFMRKEAKRFEVIDVTDEHDHNHKNYLIDNEDTNKFSLNGNVDNENLDSELKDFEGMEDADVDGDANDDGKSDKDVDLSMRAGGATAPDLRSKFDLDMDLRKPYDMDGELRRSYTDSLDDFRMKNYDLDNLDALRSNLERKTYESLIDDFRTDRNFEPLVLNPAELQGLDMSARGYHNYPNLNRYHHLYGEVDRPTVDLRLNYSPPPPPPPAYTHSDILRVSLDLAAQPTRHSVDLSLRSQIANSRLLTEHGLQPSRLLPGDRLISDMSNRILSDHTTNRLLGNDQLGAQRLLGNEQRMLQDERLLEQPRLLDQNRLLGNGSLSPVSYSGYSVSPSPYHPTALPPRPHVASPNPAPYHHYSAYY